MKGTDRGNESAVSLDELFELLANDRRRHVLYEMNEEGHKELEDLARSVTAREIEDSNGDVPDDRLRSVAIELHHVHLPKLHEAKLLEYDYRQKDAHSSRYFSFASDLIETVREYEIE